MSCSRSAAFAVGLLTMVAGSAAAQAARSPAFKGIFEPVPFPADVALNDVFFVTPEVGWATGGNARSNGVIIGTTDAGATWTVQVGDPESSEETYSQLRFVDGRIGFAAQSAPGDHRLLRTLDGETWTMVGTLPEHREDYAFVSATVGVMTNDEKVFRTENAGKTWREVFECRLKVQIEGLTRDVRCYLENLHFPTRQVGYAIGYSPDTPGWVGAFLAKTEDAGATWTAWLALPEEKGREATLFFVDAQRGSACLYGGKLALTDDGGRTWNPVPGPSCDGKPEIRFADPEVGWSVVYHALAFTVNGGRSWSGRTIQFPTMVNAFSLPRRDAGFVVGDHGMVYRYRVVPAAEPTASSVLPAPAMPVLSDGFDEQIGALDVLIMELEQAVTAAPDSFPDSMAVDSMPAFPPFEPLPPYDPTAESFPIPEDQLPDASPFTQSCCGEPQSRTRTLLSTIIDALPQLLEKYRNTNTLGGALLMLVELPLKVTGVRNAIAAFWQAPDKAGALQALAEMSAAVAELKTSSAMVFQRDPASVPALEGGSPSGMDGEALESAAARADSTGETGQSVLERAAGEARRGLGGLIKKKVRIR